MKHGGLTEQKDMDLPIIDIELPRGTTGLGFNIRGGVDNPFLPGTGDTGIFVTKIREDGTAFKDGRLKEGDKILEVNGVDLSSVMHQEAVNCFINAGERVHMKVQQGAEAYILKKSQDLQGKGMDRGNNPGDTSRSSWKLPSLLLLLGFAGAAAGAFYYWRQRMR